MIYMTDEKTTNKSKPKSAPESAPELVPDPVLNPQVGTTIQIKEADPDRTTLERARRFLNSLEDK